MLIFFSRILIHFDCFLAIYLLLNVGQKRGNKKSFICICVVAVKGYFLIYAKHYFRFPVVTSASSELFCSRLLVEDAAATAAAAAAAALASAAPAAAPAAGQINTGLY